MNVFCIVTLNMEIFWLNGRNYDFMGEGCGRFKIKGGTVL